ncbi:MAG TPA: BON domain-containing protein [Chloroflexota bacterium]
MQNLWRREAPSFLAPFPTFFPITSGSELVAPWPVGPLLFFGAPPPGLATVPAGPVLAGGYAVPPASPFIAPRAVGARTLLPMWFGGYGLGGLRRHGGSYSPQYVSTGLPTDEEIVEMVYDALDDDPFVPVQAAIEVACESGVVTLKGTVPSKNIKRSAGDDAWWIPGVVDVRNELAVSGPHRHRGQHREV